MLFDSSDFFSGAPLSIDASASAAPVSRDEQQLIAQARAQNRYSRHPIESIRKLASIGDGVSFSVQLQGVSAPFSISVDDLVALAKGGVTSDSLIGNDAAFGLRRGGGGGGRSGRSHGASSRLRSKSSRSSSSSSGGSDPSVVYLSAIEEEFPVDEDVEFGAIDIEDDLSPGIFAGFLDESDESFGASSTPQTTDYSKCDCKEIESKVKYYEEKTWKATILSHERAYYEAKANAVAAFRSICDQNKSCKDEKTTDYSYLSCTEKDKKEKYWVDKAWKETIGSPERERCEAKANSIRAFTTSCIYAEEAKEKGWGGSSKSSSSSSSSSSKSSSSSATSEASTSSGAEAEAESSSPQRLLSLGTVGLRAISAGETDKAHRVAERILAISDAGSPPASAQCVLDWHASGSLSSSCSSLSSSVRSTGGGALASRRSTAPTSASRASRPTPRPAAAAHRAAERHAERRQEARTAERRQEARTAERHAERRHEARLEAAHRPGSSSKPYVRSVPSTVAAPRSSSTSRSVFHGSVEAIDSGVDEAFGLSRLDLFDEAE